jgi:HEAT repeat protein
MDGHIQDNPDTPEAPDEPQRSTVGVIVHSFFIVPFLIAVFCALLFMAGMMLTREQKTAFDYLEDIRIGGSTKRWQSAFELSKFLANPDRVPDGERFAAEMISVFERAQAQQDDTRVREYMALAMGRTGDPQYLEALLAAIDGTDENLLLSAIYALGMLQDQRAITKLQPFLGHSRARIRSITVVALANIGDPAVMPLLRGVLTDAEPNVRWGSAIALARLGDASGKETLLDLLDPDYLAEFPAVDARERSDLRVATIEAAGRLGEEDVRLKIEELSEDADMKVRAAAKNYLHQLKQS